MPKLTLYHAAPSRSSIVHWMLEEVGEPYDIHLVSFKKGENRKPDYPGDQPDGQGAGAQARRRVITEAAAICTYLADEFPKAKLNVPVGDPRRGVYLKWLFFGPSCVEPAITSAPSRARSRRRAPRWASATSTRVVDVLAKAAGAAKPYLMGEQFTAADVVIGSGLRWGMMFKLLPERPEFAAYVGRLAERPALKRATEKDARLQKQQEG